MTKKEKTEEDRERGTAAGEPGGTLDVELRDRPDLKGNVAGRKAW